MNLFAYGSLMDPEIMEGVSHVRRTAEPATLAGYVRKRLRGEVYPGVTAEPGSSVAGVLYRDVTAAAFVRLDAFESALYVRSEVEVHCADGATASALAYVMEAAHRSELSSEDWSYEHFLAHDRAAFWERHREK